MSGADQTDIQAEYSIDPPNDKNRMWVSSFDFSDAEGYETITYTYTNDSDSRCRFMGVIIIDGSASYLPKYIYPEYADVIDTRISDDVELSWSNIEQDPNNTNDLSVEVLFGTDPNETDGDMKALPLIPVPGQEPNSVTVPDLADGIYYWQVNSTFW